MVKETDYLGNTLKYIYDKLNSVTDKIDQYDITIEKLEYDNLGRQIKSTNANGDYIEYTYDANNNILTKKDEEGNIETYEYDVLNNKTKYTDKNQNVTAYEYDSKNNLTKVKNALNEVNTYTYDNQGNVLTQKDASSNVISFVYDINGNEIKKIDQLSNEDVKTYYQNGLLKTFKTNNGDIFTYTYDVHDRLVSEEVNNEVTTYEYDNNSNKTKIGNILKTYDELNRVISSTENGKTVSYTYLDDDKKLVVTDPNQNVTTEEYDKVGRLKKVTSSGKVTEYEYNNDGSLNKQVDESKVSEYEYYKDKMLKNLTTKTKSGILIEENSYEYDANNNILKDNSKVYTYDALNRIKTTNDTEYTYDKSGNIASKTVIDGNTIKATTYIYNAKNQLTKSNVLENTALVSETTYSYDLNGNQIEEVANGQTVTNTYNARNELIKVEKGQAISEYSYNSAGKRIQKVTDNNTINFVYDSDNVILELDENGNEVATNTYGLNLIKRETGDDEGYYVYNGHGDVTKVIDTTNEELNTYVYDEFGSIKEENETFNNPFKYAGYYYDNETKTYYLRSRYYNPEIQRFISEDTYRGELNDPLSLNYYTYVNNNPLIYNDPDGHFAKEILGAFKYVAKRSIAFIHGGMEFALDTVKGLAGLAWNLGETLGSEIGIIGNEIGYKAGIVNETKYVDDKDYYLSILSQNMNMYKQLPGNMISGIWDNLKTTFNWNNFKNYLNPNTSYEELKDYSKSAIQTGVTIYSGYEVLKSAYSTANKIYNGIKVNKFIKENVPIDSQLDVKNAFTSDAKVTTLKNDTAAYRYSGVKSGGNGKWYTPNQTQNPIVDLALPKSNPATYVNKYIIPKGTTIIKGTVAPNFGQAGGWLQFYVPNPSVILPIK